MQDPRILSLPNLISGKVERIKSLLKSLPLEVKAKPLPLTYHNWDTSCWQNRKIRVDHIPKSATTGWCWSITDVVGVTDLEIYVEDESRFCAFLTFLYHGYAARFVEKFNNKQIPGTGMFYQLSWAPFYHNPLIVPGYEKDGRHRKPPAEDEMKKERGKEGKPCMSDNVASVMFEQVADEELILKFRAFHGSLKKVAIENKALWDCGLFATQGVELCSDDGRTTILCLMMVDPCVEESSMKSIFGQYGDCDVNLPDKEGCGLVKFKERTFAEQAFVDLDTVLTDENVCWLGWGRDLVI